MSKIMRYIVFLLLLVLAFRAANYAGAQATEPGFISIDCGLPNNSEYTDLFTGISYKSDSGFIDSGVSKSISLAYKSNSLEEHLWNVRSFPQGKRNCYTLRPTVGKGGRYLIKARFFYGNYDAANDPPEFDLHVGLEYWQTIKIKIHDSTHNEDIIYSSQSDYINVCLIRTGRGIPFISSLELRPLPTEVYFTPPGLLMLEFRVKFTNLTTIETRYKDDIYDRVWEAHEIPVTTTLSTTSPISTNGLYAIPQAVLSSAATPTNSSGNLKFFWNAASVTSQNYVYLYFAELEMLQPKQSRQFNVYINNNIKAENYTPKYLSTTVLYTIEPEMDAIPYEVVINKSINSTLPPIINAAEAYSFRTFSLPETIEGDVTAVSNIKSTYLLSKNWQGDPCGPDNFTWEGVTCNPRDGFNSRRIVALNLSFNGLNGMIASSIFNLTMLQNLDLSNNYLNGLVPEFLARMASLQVLNLKGNNFTGPCPPELLEKHKQGKLQFSCDDGGASSGNAHPSKKNKSVVPIVIGVVLFVLFALLIAFFVFRKNHKVFMKVKIQSNRDKEIVELREGHLYGKSYDMLEPNNNGIMGSKRRQFTYDEVLSMTNNLERVIGKGGFGSVYHGYIGKTQVAVKMLSESSNQGYKEFQAEANLLLTIHHKNLTSLVGYCYDGENMGIIYEYMSNGNVEKYLLGKSTYVLTWEERLRIAIDAGQGLEYLHHGCIPPIVHRDVKTTNILLDDKFQAKLADFGLSRAFSIDGVTQVSTMVAGTLGYLDPEYYSSTRLTEKSDVYSFGIMLLEMVTGRSALPRNKTEEHISIWVSLEFEKGDINNIIDPKLQKDYAIDTIWKVIKLAMACVARGSSGRPTMNMVVMELKACLVIEMSRNDIESNYSVEIGLGPNAR